MQQYLMPDVVEAYVESMESIQMDTNIWMILTSILLATIGKELLYRGIIPCMLLHLVVNLLSALGFGMVAYGFRKKSS